MLRQVRRNRVNEGTTSELNTLKTIVRAMVNRASIRTDILSLKLKDVEFTGNIGVCEDLLITITLGLLVSMEEDNYYHALTGNNYSKMSNDVEIVIELDPREGFHVAYRTHDAGSKSYRLKTSGTYQEAYVTQYPKHASYSYLLSDDIEHDLLNAIYGAIDRGEKHRYYVDFGRRESRMNRRYKEFSLRKESSSNTQPMKFSDIIISDTLLDYSDQAMKAKRKQWDIPDAAETVIQICMNFNKLCELEGRGSSKERLLELAEDVQDLVQMSNNEMDGGAWERSWKRWLGSDFNYVKRQMREFAEDLAKAIYDLKRS